MNNISVEDVKETDKGRAYDDKRSFEKNLWKLASDTQENILPSIIAVKPNHDTPTLEGGFCWWLDWYKSKSTNA